MITVLAVSNTMQFDVTGHSEIRSQYVTLFATKSLHVHSCGIISKYCNRTLLSCQSNQPNVTAFPEELIHYTSSQCTFLISLRHYPERTSSQTLLLHFHELLAFPIRTTCPAHLNSHFITARISTGRCRWP